MDRQLGSKPHWRGSSFTVLTSSPEVVRQYLPTLTNLPAVIDFAERIRGLRSGFGRLAGICAETSSNFLNFCKVLTSSLLEVYGPLPMPGREGAGSCRPLDCSRNGRCRPGPRSFRNRNRWAGALVSTRSTRRDNRSCPSPGYGDAMDGCGRGSTCTRRCGRQISARSLLGSAERRRRLSQSVAVLHPFRIPYIAAPPRPHVAHQLARNPSS